MVGMALIITMALWVGSQDSVLTASVCGVNVEPDLSSLDAEAEEIRIIRYLKPLRCGVASSNLHALSWDRNQAIAAPAHGFNR